MKILKRNRNSRDKKMQCRRWKLHWADIAIDYTLQNEKMKTWIWSYDNDPD